MKKRYTYRAYPSTRQQRDLARVFGCCRKVYNDTIAVHSANYEAGTARMSASETQSFVVTEGRRRHPWLAAVSSVALIQSVRDAEQAFSHFFASATGTRKGPKVGYPRYKSRFSGTQSARFTRNGFRLNNDRLFIAKIGWIRFTLSRELPSMPSSVTVIRRPDGTFDVSFVVEATPEPLTPDTPRHAGIDLGLDSFASIAYSDGTRQKIAHPRFAKKQARKLRTAQRALSRKQGPDARTHTPASENWKKQQRKVARAHHGVKNARQDFARKLARQLASENTTIAVERLNIRGLARSGGHNAQGRGLRRSLHDAAWSAFIAALHDKAGERVIEVNPAHTSQTCSVCETLDGPKPLRVRAWTCQGCGARLDRDYNAALNIMLAAGQVERVNACGREVRLQLAGAHSGEAGTRWSDAEVAA